MSFAQLEQTITKEAGLEIEQVRKKLRQEFEREEKRIYEKARKAEESIVAVAQATAAQKAKRLHQTAQLMAKADVLAAKQEEIDRANEAAVQKILGWPEEKTVNLLNNLLGLIPEDKGVITAGVFHREKVKALAGNKYTLSAETIAGDGGFVFRGEKAEYHLTVRQLAARAFAIHRAELARILFS